MQDSFCALTGLTETDMTGTIRLWGTGTSRTLRPIWVAEELGLSYDLTPMGPRTGETQTPEYTQLNPKQKIPLLIDAYVQLSESVAISLYLADQYEGGDLFRPRNAVERARLQDLCCYVYGELDETSLYVMRRHGALGQVYGAAPGVVSSAAAYASRHLNVLNGLLDDRPFLLPEGFSVADILLQTCLDWALAYNLSLPDKLSLYRERIAQRPAYQRACAINFAGN
jgi:glutathione S-transferase